MTSNETHRRKERQLFHLLEKSIAVGLLAALMFTVIVHGAVEPWSVALFELMLIAVMLLWAMKAVVDGQLDVTVPPAALPIAALLVLGIVQSVTPLSTDREATRHAVTILFFLSFSFIVAANCFVSPERLLLLANVLTVFGAVLAAFALIQYFTWDGRFYWLRSTNRSVFGPFVNRNHFAGYMAMLAPVPLGLMLKVVRGQVRLLYQFAAVLMVTATIISRSRSGVISLAAALIVMAFLNGRSGRPTARIIAVVTLATIACVLWIGATGIIDHFGDAVDALVRFGTPDLGRATIWRDTVGIIHDYPIFGAGLGAYETIHPSYAKSPDLLELDYAHNDYLQVMADAGAIGGVITLWFFVVIFMAVRRGLHSSDSLSAGLSLAGGAGIFAVLVQSLSETNMQIPSNAALFLVLSAIVSRIGEPSAESR